VPRGYKGNPTPAMLAKMAKELGVNTLRYLDTDDLGPCIQIDGARLCTGCVTGRQPTPMGKKLIEEARRSKGDGRTYENTNGGPCKGRSRAGC